MRSTSPSRGSKIIEFKNTPLGCPTAALNRALFSPAMSGTTVSSWAILIFYFLQALRSLVTVLDITPIPASMGEAPAPRGAKRIGFANYSLGQVLAPGHGTSSPSSMLRTPLARGPMTISVLNGPERCRGAFFERASSSPTVAYASLSGCPKAIRYQHLALGGRRTVPNATSTTPSVPYASSSRRTAGILLDGSTKGCRSAVGCRAAPAPPVANASSSGGTKFVAPGHVSF